MFTGIIEDVGTIEQVRPGEGGGRTLVIKTALDPSTIGIGDSIATSGVCLTVTKKDGPLFTVDIGPETIVRTTMGELEVGSPVNLERSVTLSQRLGGHLVQGHVDAVGRIARVTPRENAFDLEVSAPPEVLRLAIPRGSIAIDGISLTLTGRTSSAFTVMIIPHTRRVTTLGAKNAGARVNLEADLIARYVAGLLEGGTAEARGGLTEAFLKENGF